MILKRAFKPDRRRKKRQLLNTSVRIFTASAQIDAVGINVSDVGMCLFTLADLALGSRVQVEFRPARYLQPIRLLATVRHRALYLYGIEFLLGSDHSDGWHRVSSLPEVSRTHS
jgi:PilZ domain